MVWLAGAASAATTAPIPCIQSVIEGPVPPGVFAVSWPAVVLVSCCGVGAMTVVPSGISMTAGARTDRVWPGVGVTTG